MPKTERIWYPLCGQLDNDFAMIMVSHRGQSHTETMTEWKALVEESGIVLGDGDILMAKDYDKFTKVMEQAGWVKQFIAFGP